MKHLTADQLAAGLDGIRQSPSEEGILHLIVRRPDVGEREVLEEAELSSTAGLVGDSWQHRPGPGRERWPDPDTQLTVMNSRVIALIAQSKERWPLAGDQLFIDLDLSAANLPPGTRLSVGSAVIEVADEPHTGCRKFVRSYGVDAMKFVNSPLGRRLQLRGINARVVHPGRIRAGDVVKKMTRHG